MSVIKICAVCGRKFATHFNAEICHICRKQIGTPCRGCEYLNDCRHIIKNRLKRDPICWFDNPYRMMFVARYKNEVGTRGTIARQLGRWEGLENE